MLSFRKSEYQKLNDELTKLGVPDCEFMSIKGSPVDTLVNTNWPSKPYTEILLEYLPKLSNNGQDMVVRALTVKGNYKASKTLLAMFRSKSTYSESLLWTVGNAIAVIRDKSSYAEVIEICKNKELRTSRQMLFFYVLPRIRTEESYQVLLDGLSDFGVRGHALDGLGKFGNVEAIEIIEALEVEKGKNEFKAKQRALKKLRKKLELSKADPK
mgnify:CR=1 FL=1